jgi:hypothetical protein
MSKLFSGSICLTDIVEQAKKGHSAFSKSQKNGKVYFNFLLWENDEVDKYDNTHSLQLNSLKDKKEAEGKIYIGNAKPIETKQPGKNDLPNEDWDSNIPVIEKGNSVTAASDITEPVDDLPF